MGSALGETQARPRFALLIRPIRPKQLTPNLFSGPALFLRRSSSPAFAAAEPGPAFGLELIRSHEKSRSLVDYGYFNYFSGESASYFVESSRFFAAKSQLTLVQKPSMNFGRKLR